MRIPLVGPVVINEIMYHPATNADAEYIELLNISGGPVTLFDFVTVEPWRLTDDSGIDFRFPTDVPVTLEAGEHVLLAQRLERAWDSIRSPPAPRCSTGAPASSPTRGRISCCSSRATWIDKGTRYWIEVDRVSYSDGSHGEEFAGGVDPWPVEADGQRPVAEPAVPVPIRQRPEQLARHDPDAGGGERLIFRECEV